MRKLEEYLQIGTVTTTHGLKGEVKVYPLTDDPERFSVLDEVILDTDKERLILHAEKARYMKGLVILKFQDYDRIEDVERFRNAALYVSRENAVALLSNEYFMTDLIGIEVFDESGEKLGNISEIITTSANDVYVVKDCDGEELLIPAIKACILDVDPEGGTMKVHLLKGLRGGDEA